MCVSGSSSFCQELKDEPYRVKYYVQDRFKDITSLIKTNPTFSCVSCLALAGAIYFIALPVFLTLSTALMLDYLASTNFYREPSPWSLAFWGLFYDMHNLQTWQPSLISEKWTEESLNEFTEVERELIEFGRNFEQEMLEEMLKKRKAYEENRRPVVLFLRAKADHNGALSNQDRAITINGNNYEGIRKLEEKYKIALIDNITHVNQIKEGLEKITNPIQQVWVFGHGSPTSIHLDGQHKIEKKDIEELAPLMQQKLSVDAHVVLYSCSTGQEIPSGENIATEFSKILPGRTIWAPKTPTGIITCDLGEDSSFKIKFWEYKNRLKYLKEKIWNICCLQPFKKIKLELNVTAQMKDGIKCSQ